MTGLTGEGWDTSRSRAMSLCRQTGASKGFRGRERHSQSHTAARVRGRVSSFHGGSVGVHSAYSFQNTPVVLLGPQDRT